MTFLIEGLHASLPLLAMLAFGATITCAPANGSGGASGANANATSSGSSSSSPPPSAPSRTGVLVAYANGTEIGRQHYEDDGHVLRSDVRLAAASFRSIVDRDHHRARVEQGGHQVERELGADVLALENGDWQAYALAVERFADASEPRPFTLLVTAQDARLPAQIAVRARSEGGGHTVTVRAGALAVRAEVDDQGHVVRVEIPAQGVVVLPEGSPPPVRPERAAPAGVHEEALEVNRGGVVTRGVLWRPANIDGPLPVVLLVAGSGPTDRDGNNNAGLQTDAYRLIAEGLAARGIASVRYDKRGVGLSDRNFAAEQLTIDDFVDDAIAWIESIRRDPRTQSLTVAGHSEGGFIAISAAARVPVDALALLATAGRTIDTILREQLGRQLDAAQMTEVDRLLGAIRRGEPLGNVPTPLRPLFNPTVARFLRSELDVDPVALLRPLHVPTLVLQGETDAQVTPVDARALAAAHEGIRMVLLPQANHVFKVEATPTLPQASYADASRPLAPGVIDAIVSIVPRPGSSSSRPPSRGHGSHGGGQR